MSGGSILRPTPGPEARGPVAAARVVARVVARVAAALVVACVAGVACNAPPPGPAPRVDDRALADRVGVTPLEIDAPLGAWSREGFVQMVPPTRLPSTSATIDQIEVWLRLPDDAVIGLEVDPTGGAPRLTMPHGAIAERVEYLGEGSRRYVADVRGTRFGEGGRERFRVLRPRAPEPTAALVGFEWDRDDEAQHAEFTAKMIELVTSTPPVRSMADKAKDLAVARFKQINACAPCHRPNKPVNRREREGGLPNRATDASGLYTIATVLADEAPIERYRKFNRDHGDPFITFWCGLVGPREGGPEIADRPSCDDGSVPRGRLDLAAALAADDPHARALCVARLYLHRHLDADGRRAVAGAIAPCIAAGLGEAPSDPPRP